MQRTGKCDFAVDSFGLTDVGLVRKNNEDSIFVMDTVEPNALGSESFGIYLVADGLGGHNAGEVASQMAKQTISNALLDALRHDSQLPPFLLVKGAIEQAHRNILNAAKSRPELRSMGTTVTVGLRLGTDLYIGHVGDSRAYLIREKTISQLTEDHSLIAHLLRQGEITPTEACSHPDRGKILRCLGVSPDLAVDLYVQDRIESRLTLKSGDRLVFCSDGLTGHVTDQEILAHARKQNDPQAMCSGLVDLANARGGEDNISVIVVIVKDPES